MWLIYVVIDTMDGKGTAATLCLSSLWLYRSELEPRLFSFNAPLDLVEL